MAASGLAQLSPDVLVEVLSCITYNSSQLSWFSSLCRHVCATLGQDAAWRHLCRRYWYATAERIKDWPDLSPQGLYRALEQWAPLEGYYALTPAFPWGLLVLIRISDGRVLADVIRFVPLQDGSFMEVPVPLFRVTLREERPGVVRSVLDAPWSGGEAAQVSSVDPEELYAATTRISGFFASRRIVTSRLFSARRALRVTAGEGTPADDSDEEEIKGLEVGSLLQSAEQAKERTEAMLQELLGQGSVPCDLALIRSPSDFCPQDSGFPGVRPGLYVGDYGHGYYGQFRTEVLLLEYATFAPEDILTEAPKTIFARPEGEPAPSDLRLLTHATSPVTFMRGVKQCGDVHVPMGATTFVAVCGPPEACAALSGERSPPSSVMNRQSGRMEAVRRAWRGFGTLAMQGFRHPSWDGGWLVQLESVGSNGDHRFGFVWDRQQDAVVLRWITAQDTSSFLQRAWLPEDLR
uniref:F-box domain-containing protein n=1 Tax=Alexandrium monilatum TaxID=311494 RepID=A0A7S4UYN2_9DINO|mmetsp:Transcript_46650/g.146198  ORF Transcript_46650/g.146198 Transcript_46650/m.146198 type:complete len:464 (-) Transcript_46650:44-1435(-)